MYNMTPIKSSTMYVPQDEHLQPEECNIIIRDLKEVTMQACTRKERLARTAENRDSATKRQADIQKKMGELKSTDWRENMREKLDKQ